MSLFSPLSFPAPYILLNPITPFPPATDDTIISHSVHLRTIHLFLSSSSPLCLSSFFCLPHTNTFLFHYCVSLSAFISFNSLPPHTYALFSYAASASLQSAPSSSSSFSALFFVLTDSTLSNLHCSTSLLLFVFVSYSLFPLCPVTMSDFHLSSILCFSEFVIFPSSVFTQFPSFLCFHYVSLTHMNLCVVLHTLYNYSMPFNFFPYIFKFFH